MLQLDDAKLTGPSIAAVYIAAFAALNVVPRGGKSVLDMLMGLASRLKP